MSCDGVGLGKEGSQCTESREGYSYAARLINHLLWLVWPRPTCVNSSGVGEGTQPWTGD